MTLFEYMNKNGLDRNALAKELGYSRSAIDGYFKMAFEVSERFAKLVEMYTQGQVKAKDMIKRSKLGMKKRAELKNSTQERKSETATFCRGLCKMCNKKLNEIEL